VNTKTGAAWAKQQKEKSRSPNQEERKIKGGGEDERRGPAKPWTKKKFKRGRFEPVN